MLKDASLLIKFWDKAVEADAYLRNRTTLADNKRVPNIADRIELKEPVQFLLEALRYFIRGSKRKRPSEDTAEDKRFRKIIKAILAQVNLTDEEVDEEA
ncbi:hypothetical protein PtrM4_047690 [Pyrenophora tritici-repentis]|uniref:Uncharacterized protein n=1 Tax=Pyrenophora tritici-repentis TaxID=45151 RepID=A0A834RL12_9PLEO|nr:hypothetical protein PtrM4_047690 [Pyrenophora tritici-repentis]